MKSYHMQKFTNHANSKHYCYVTSTKPQRASSFGFSLFGLPQREKVFSIRLGQLRLPPLLQPSLCLLSLNPSIFSLAFLSVSFSRYCHLYHFFSQRNLLLSSSRVHTNVILCLEVCFPASQFLPSLSHTRSLSCPFLQPQMSIYHF